MTYDTPWDVSLDFKAAKFRRDCGARRFAADWTVAQIKTTFGAGAETGEYDSAVWPVYSLRKRWNQAKGEVAPWWAECSKEACSDGLAAAVTAVQNWHAPETGKREGPKMRFPRCRLP